MDAPQWLARCRDLIKLLPVSPRSPVAARPHLAASRSFSSFLPNKRDRKTERGPSSPSTRRLAQTAAAAVATAYGSGTSASGAQTPLSPAGRGLQSFSAFAQTSVRHAIDDARGSTASTASQRLLASAASADDESVPNDAQEQPRDRVDSSATSAVASTAKPQADPSIVQDAQAPSAPAHAADTAARNDKRDCEIDNAQEPLPSGSDAQEAALDQPTATNNGKRDDGHMHSVPTPDALSAESKEIDETAPSANGSHSSLAPLAPQDAHEAHEGGERRDHTPQSIDLGQTDDEHGPDTSDDEDSDRCLSPVSTGFDESFEALSAQSRSDSSNNVVDTASGTRHGSHGSASEGMRKTLHPSVTDQSYAQPCAPASATNGVEASTTPTAMPSQQSPERSAPAPPPGQGQKLVLSLGALDGHSEVDAETDEPPSQSTATIIRHTAMSESELSGGDVADPELGSLLPAAAAAAHTSIIGSATMKLFAGAAAALLSKSPGPALTPQSSVTPALTPTPVSATPSSPPKLPATVTPGFSQLASLQPQAGQPLISQRTPQSPMHPVSTSESEASTMKNKGDHGGSHTTTLSLSESVVAEPITASPSQAPPAAEGESPAMIAEPYAPLTRASHLPSAAPASDSAYQDDLAQVPMRRATGRQSSAFSALSSLGTDRSTVAATQASGTDEVLAERELSDVTLHRKGRIRSLLFKPPSLTDPAANVNLEVCACVPVRVRACACTCLRACACV
jgi:hypothetical protein